VSGKRPSTNDPGPPCRRAGKISPPLTIFAAIFILAWCCTLFVVAVDPLDLYPWGIPAKLDGADYNQDAAPYILDAVVKDPTIDVVLVGGSTATLFTRAMMNRLLPGAKNAINLSYSAPYPADRAIVMDRIARFGNPKRVIVMLDYIYSLPAKKILPVFPSYLYDDSILNDARMVGSDTIQLSIERLAGRSLRLPAWDSGRYRSALARNYREFQTRETMEEIRDKIVVKSAGSDTASALFCADLDSINLQLVPEAKAFSARHIALDVVIPPLSLAAYHNGVGFTDGAFMNSQLALRRCAVRALDGIEGVRVFSFDNDVWLTGDLANYHDPRHAFGVRVFEYMLRSIAEGSHRLTRRNVDVEVKLFHDNILRYRVYDSKVRGFDGRGF
jgi:hypothetical protein